MIRPCLINHENLSPRLGSQVPGAGAVRDSGYIAACLLLLSLLLLLLLFPPSGVDVPNLMPISGDHIPATGIGVGGTVGGATGARVGWGAGRGSLLVGAVAVVKGWRGENGIGEEPLMGDDWRCWRNGCCCCLIP